MSEDSTPSRRSVLAGTAAGAASLALPAAAATIEPDPIFALIDEHRRAWKEFGQVLRALSEAEESLNQDGSMRPHAFFDTGDGKVLMYTPKEINEKVPTSTFPRLNATLQAQLKAEIERKEQILAPHKEAEEEYGDIALDAEAELLATPPRTMAGLAALLTYVRQHVERDGDSYLAGLPTTFLNSLESSAAALAGSPVSVVES
jgi:hypothetical protein